MTFHELATNAAKHGALSSKSGKVDVRWRREECGERLVLCWTERGGPRTGPPARRGFGRTLLERALKAELSGDVDLQFQSEGVQCELRVPMT
jgi:two-component sensor histidine kinase